jgi:putative hemolysin
MRVISSIIIFLLAGAVSISAHEAKNKQHSSSSNLRSRGQSSSRMLAADPASVNCIDNGGSQQMLHTVNGDQWAVCTFADGSACEEWALLRGECNKGEMLAFITDCKKNQGNYKGHRIDTTMYAPDGGAIQGFYYTCQYANGSVCFDYDYYDGKC